MVAAIGACERSAVYARAGKARNAVGHPQRAPITCEDSLPQTINAAAAWRTKKANRRTSLRLVAELTSKGDCSQPGAGASWLRLPSLHVPHLGLPHFNPLARHFRSRDPTPPRATSGGDGGSSGGTGGDGGGSGDSGDDDKILSAKEVDAWAAERNLKLPVDLLQTAAKCGLRLSALQAYARLQGLFFTGFLVRTVPWVRDRMIADHRFLFKVGAEIVIDSGCATVAEVRKRGDDFWHEFEFYLSDLLVGLVMDVALVGLMAPVAVVGGVSRAASATGLQRLLAGVPSAVFQANTPGLAPYGLGQRLSCLLVKFGEYSLAGIACGLVGTAIANSAMHFKRKHYGASEDDVPVPPLVKTALVWGLFMGVSANLRYQAVFGLERLVDLTIARSVPQVAYGTTVAIRFVNNVIGGENFIDMARWAGVQ